MLLAAELSVKDDPTTVAPIAPQKQVVIANYGATSTISMIPVGDIWIGALLSRTFQVHVLLHPSKVNKYKENKYT